MNTAQFVRLNKEHHPENYCKAKNCLWRTSTRDGFKPCPRHQAGLVAAEKALHDSHRLSQLLKPVAGCSGCGSTFGHKEGCPNALDHLRVAAVLHGKPLC